MCFKDLMWLNGQIDLELVSNDQFEHNKKVMNVIKWIEMVLGFNWGIQGLFRKYEFPHIASNAETLDTYTYISSSMLTSVIIAIPFDVNWIK